MKFKRYLRQCVNWAGDDVTSFWTANSDSPYWGVDSTGTRYQDDGKTLNDMAELLGVQREVEVFIKEKAEAHRCDTSSYFSRCYSGVGPPVPRSLATVKLTC